MAGRIVHVGMTKLLLLNLIRNDGAVKVLVNWQGTDEEAIEAVAADPREIFTLTPECDRQDERGHCMGHPK
jgi:hypothetical protein